MDQTATIKLIEQHMLSRHGSHWLTATSVKPAWKYAFYNPAKKNKEGAIVIKRDYTILIVYAVLIAGLSTLFTIKRIYNLFYFLPLAVMLFAFIRYYYNSNPMIVSATGITFNSHTYQWKDYNGAFISYTTLHKNLDIQLILVDSAHQLTYLNITDIGKCNTIGTAIRDFQPAEWKY